jgi:hypothetical protein
MKHLLAFLLLALTPALVLAQFSVTATIPADGATSVPTHTILAVAFSAPIDTSTRLDDGMGFFSSVDSVEAIWFSTTRDTIYVAAVLPPNTPQFLLVYGIRSSTGQGLSSPAGIYFTTGASFPPYSISGTVLAGASGVDPAGSMVVVAPEPLGGGTPRMIMGAIADGSGNFAIPYLNDGVYYPIAAKDITDDGDVDPGKGDPIALGDSVVVSGTSVTGVTLAFLTFDLMTMDEGWALAEAAADVMLPADKVLRIIEAYDVDPVGLAWDWQFYYSSASSGQAWALRSSPFGIELEMRHPSEYGWIVGLKPVPSPDGAASSAVFGANVEAAGGAAFRAAVPDSLDLFIHYYLGDVKNRNFWGLVPDTSQWYWAAEYQYGVRPRPDTIAVFAEKRFLGSFATGEILAVTDVREDPVEGNQPGQISLRQNYPNPFNPSTVIEYTLPARSRVTLSVVDLLGRAIATLVDDEMAPGAHQARWDAVGATGVYFYRLTVAPVGTQGPPAVLLRKMMIVR